MQLYSATNDRLPRYTIHVIDKEQRSKNKFAVFIAPQGRYVTDLLRLFIIRLVTSGHPYDVVVAGLVPQQQSVLDTLDAGISAWSNQSAIPVQSVVRMIYTVGL